jgi:hypothetical protein
MRKGRLGAGLAGAAVALALGGCKSIEITTSSESATSYHGKWSGEGVEMEITPRKTLNSSKLVEVTKAGRFHYKNRAKQTLLDCVFEGLSSNDIVYDCGDVNQVLKVDVAPHQRDGKWVMQIAGVELTRS